MHRRQNVSGLLAVLRLDEDNKEVADYLLLQSSLIKRHYLVLSEVSSMKGITRVRTLEEAIARIKRLLLDVTRKDIAHDADR